VLWQVDVVEGHGAPGEVLGLVPLTVACGQKAVAVRRAQAEDDSLSLNIGERLGA
jgi:methionyl-tRNA formyltransferase